MWLTGMIWAVWSLLLVGGFVWWVRRVHRRLVTQQRQREDCAVRIAQHAWELKKSTSSKTDSAATP